MKVLVTGANGQLGTDVVAQLSAPGHHDVLATDVDELDISSRQAVLSAVTGWRPDLIVNCAAMTAVDRCETEVDLAYRLNALAPRHLAEGAARVGAHMVHVSTDYVFDGTKTGPYLEWDEPNPQSVYGRSKLAGEREVLSIAPGSTVVRTAWVCGVHGANMVKTALRLSEGGGPLRFVDDQHGCPTFTDDLAGMLIRLGVDRRPGIFHVTNQGATTWYQFVRDVIAAAGRDPSMVSPIATAEYPTPATRPANSVLDNAALRLSDLPLLADHHEPLERTVRALLS